MGVYKKLSLARAKLQQMPIKKSGYNEYSNFYYFELADFLPSVNLIFAEIGLCSRFEISSFDEIGLVASLSIVDVDDPAHEYITFSSPAADATMKGLTSIQMLGSQHTYMRRYLWLEAMEICESDGVDAVSGKEQQEKPVKKPVNEQPKKASIPMITEPQMKMIKDIAGDRLEGLLKYYKVKALNELTVAQAAEAIETLKKGKSNG